jgi:invasion protein IalB
MEQLAADDIVLKVLGLSTCSPDGCCAKKTLDEEVARRCLWPYCRNARG